MITIGPGIEREIPDILVEHNDIVHGQLWRIKPVGRESIAHPAFSIIPSLNDELFSTVMKVFSKEAHLFGDRKEVNHFFLSGFFSRSA